MAKQTFTAGQVLTAAQMTSLQANDYNWTTSAQTASYVLTAANAGQTVTMTSASATTITVNTSLFTAGDRVSILNLGAGACTITAGTATVNTAGSLVLPQYGSGTLWFSSASAAIFIPDDRNSGLTLITAQTIGTAVSSVSVNDVFSATYDNYRIVINGSTASTSLNFLMQLGSTTTAYYRASLGFTYGGATNSGAASNTSAFNLVSADANGFSASADVIQPFLAARTTLVSLNPAIDTLGSLYVHGGYQNSATSFTGFTLTTSTGTVTGGTIRVYGYQNS